MNIPNLPNSYCIKAAEVVPMLLWMCPGRDKAASCLMNVRCDCTEPVLLPRRPRPLPTSQLELQTILRV